MPSPAGHDVMRCSLAVLLGLGLLLALALPAGRIPASSAASAPAPPLIVLVTVDSLRADHLGVYGYRRPTSPHIDAFARESVVVEYAIAQAPYTKASIASLMTGLYPTAHKTYTTAATVADAMDGEVDGARGTTDVLPESVTTLAEALKGRGYTTVGFTANPFLIRDFGFAQGFDVFLFLAEEGFAPATKLFGRALRAIDERAGPLFVWVHAMEPHSPYAPAESFEGELPLLVPPRAIPDSVSVPAYLAPGASRDARFYETLYDREIRNVDRAFGGFMAALRASAAWPETIVVLTSDHGEQFLEHGGLEHNTVLYDELVRVPLIMRVPGLGARVLPSQVQLVDVAPTLLALAGGTATVGAHGHDLSGLLRGEAHTSHPAYSEIVGHQYAVRTREWKLIAGAGRRRELYALMRDPGEQHDLAHANTRQVAALTQVLEGMIASAVNAGRGVTGTRAPVDAATIKRLEALGYVQR